MTVLWGLMPRTTQTRPLTVVLSQMLLLLVRRQCHISDINQMIIKRAKELCLVVNPDPGSRDYFLVTAQQLW